MTATIYQSSQLVDVATQTDAHSFTFTRIRTQEFKLVGSPQVSKTMTDGTLDGIPCITGGITALVASVGCTLRGRTANDFPWKTMLRELTQLGCCLINYPEDTLMPGEIQPSLSRTKGIHGLTMPHRANLIIALKTGTLTIRAVTDDAAHMRLMMSKDPVIIREAPSHHSPHSCGRRPRRLPSPPSPSPTGSSTPRPSAPPTGPPTGPSGPPTEPSGPSTGPSGPPTRRYVQVYVEISCPPPRPASRAVRQAIPPSTSQDHSPWQASRAMPPAITPTRDLIPPITSVARVASSSEYVDDDANDEIDSSESDNRPVKRLRWYSSK
ncbi:hypothetical protein EV702DRAFT_1197488 [Suillus placidus]|uniref:Uncharacterized protein n=1 Tax=Suillus placidus TaxID=48579 RepID=A0A9P7D2Y6_9AGAM|nr:hypothetical protein EV702DRAFT_1197488 [Suillus placidus]